MNSEEYFDQIDQLEIERFVNEQQEENVFLEFKTVNHPNYQDGNKDYDKANLSKILSGFANSDGGIVIWGIKASENSRGQDVAKEIKPINQLTKFLNLLNKLEGQVIIPLITGVKHEKIDIGNDSGFIKTFVPKSQNPPHMAISSGNHYYKRSGDSFYQCEHFDIVDIFSRKKSPSLKIEVKILPKQKVHQIRNRYAVIISILNDGESIAKFPYLAMNLTNGFHSDQYGLDGNRGCGLKKVKNSLSFQNNYSGGNEIVIYPGVKLDVDKFIVETELDAPPTLVIIYLLTAENMTAVKDKTLILPEQFEREA